LLSSRIGAGVGIVCERGTSCAKCGSCQGSDWRGNYRPSLRPPTRLRLRSLLHQRFENLVRSLGQNAAMLLADIGTREPGSPMLDLEGAREND